MIIIGLNFKITTTTTTILFENCCDEHNFYCWKNEIALIFVV